ncbi:hypothetical protein C8247_10130 [Paracidovorax avenae]|uniref:lipase family protein n=1 Tax=Paracidovorax avenae TaxID=80867 RepID=UPI000D15144A|nr:hypothetical protein [Paracidovorax avenae]AVS70744.1 hypothetical protein C8247_10130 [Paracidovorax avenae]
MHLPTRAAPRLAVHGPLAARPGPAHPAPPRNVAHPPGGIDLTQVDLGRALACVDLPTAPVEGGGHVPALGAVGMGWKDRWHEEARASRAEGRTLRSLLAASAADARNAGRLLSVSVTGHSLGAAVGILAGVDIANFLRHKEIDGQVSTYAFNPPRIAPDGIERRFKEALELRLGSSPGMRFALRQFVREQDPIQSMPLGMRHPAWSHPQGSRVARMDLAHAVIATCTDRPASRWNPAVNHDLSPWKEAIGRDMSGGELRSLFR